MGPKALRRATIETPRPRRAVTPGCRSLAWLTGLFLVGTMGCQVPDATQLDETPAGDHATLTAARSPVRIVADTIAGGQTHMVPIELEAGEYLEVSVTGPEADLVLSLVSPAGDHHAMDGEGSGGTETIRWVARSAGRHEISVSPYSHEAVAAGYRLRLGPTRQADPRDRAAAAATRASARALRLEGVATPEAREQAVETWVSAVGAWHRLNEPREEAKAWNGVGRSQARLWQLDAAVSSQERALALWRSTGDRRGEASTRNELGRVQQSRGDLESAASAYTEVLRLRRELGDEAGEAQALNNLGVLGTQTGHRHEARAFLEEALRIRQRLGDGRGIVATRLNLGRLLNDLGLLEAGQQHLLAAHERAVELGYLEAEAMSLHNLGVGHARAGNLQAALQSYLEALGAHRRLGDMAAIALTLRNLGALYEQLGVDDRAREHYDEALRVSEAMQSLSAQASSLAFLGQYEVGHDEGEAGRAHLERALEMARQTGEGEAEALALKGLGELHARAGDPDRASELLEAALARSDGLRDPYQLAGTHSRLAEIYLSAGRLAEAEDSWREALELQRGLGDDVGEAGSLAALARVARLRGDFVAAKEELEQALDLVESVRAGIGSDDLRSSFLGKRDGIYTQYVDLLLDLAAAEPGKGHLVAAFEASERARARGLREALEHDADGDTANPELEARKRALREEINVKEWYRSQLLASDDRGDDAELGELDNELRSRLEQYEVLEAELRASRPEETRLAPLSLAAIREQVLDDESLLLHYRLGETKSSLWAVSRERLRVFELPARATIESLVDRAYDHLTARNRSLEEETLEARRERVAHADTELAELAAELGQMLVAPALAEEAPRRLVIVADGALHYLPFAALTLEPGDRAASSPPVPLVARYEVVHLPSASVLATQRRRSRSLPTREVAVLADPVFQAEDARVRSRTAGLLDDSQPPGAAADDVVTRSARDLGIDSFGRLRFSRREAEAIARLAPPEQSLTALDFAASREAVTTGSLDSYRYLHFATHALLNDRHPELSGIVLSLVDPEGRAQDGFLRQHDILDLDLRADLVVLSACRTALGRQVRGEGLLGLPRAFMFAGASRVMASLWQVNDRPTSELMVGVYAGMLEQELPPSAALRQAQLSMWRQGRPPYEWAAFTLQGDWR